LWVGVLALSYASFIALGAALSFHWLSDVLRYYLRSLPRNFDKPPL